MEEQKKLTYEQLNNACDQLWQQNKQLYKENQELKQLALSKRLDYLFKAVEYSKEFSSDFIGDCTKEIEEILTVSQDTTKQEEMQHE